MRFWLTLVTIVVVYAVCWPAIRQSILIPLW
jgi:hypothetical protein